MANPYHDPKTGEFTTGAGGAQLVGGAHVKPLREQFADRLKKA